MNKLDVLDNPVKLEGAVYIKDLLDALNILQNQYNEINNFIDNPNPIAKYGDKFIANINFTGDNLNTYPSGAVKLFINSIPDGWTKLPNAYIKIGNTDYTVRGNTNRSHSHNFNIYYNKSYPYGASKYTRLSKTGYGHTEYYTTNMVNDNISVNMNGTVNSEGGVNAEAKHIAFLMGYKN